MSDFGTFLKIEEVGNCVILNTSYFTVTFRSTESMYCKSLYDKDLLSKVVGKDINNVYILGRRGFRRFEDEISIFEKEPYAYPQGEVENIAIYAGRNEIKIGVLGSLSVIIEPVKASII